jgi:hypothetical protein
VLSCVEKFLALLLRLSWVSLSIAQSIFLAARWFLGSIKV